MASSKREKLYQAAVFSPELKPLADVLRTAEGFGTVMAHLEQNPEDVEDLPSGAVFFDFKSRGYSYGEMIDRVDRLKILGELNDLDQPRNRHQRRGY